MRENHDIRQRPRKSEDRRTLSPARILGDNPSAETEKIDLYFYLSITFVQRK